jgi:hypothetical protein
MRAFLLFLAVIATPVIAAQQPLVGKELAAFLGPVSPQTFRWQKYTMIDFEIYQGEAKPPLAGHVSFYLGGHPDFKPPPGSQTLQGRLGRYRVSWYRSHEKNGSITYCALIPLERYWQVDLAVNAKRREDIDRLIATISQLPIFASKPKPGFGRTRQSIHGRRPNQSLQPTSSRLVSSLFHD